jgi:hypothetical protein
MYLSDAAPYRIAPIPALLSSMVSCLVKLTIDSFSLCFVHGRIIDRLTRETGNNRNNQGDSRYA